MHIHYPKLHPVSTTYILYYSYKVNKPVHKDDFPFLKLLPPMRVWNNTKCCKIINFIY